MMFVFRICQTRYAEDTSGEGARLFGGRWNLPMIPCLYTSESRSLALLEYSVNITMHEIRRALSFVTYQINDHDIYEIQVADLPGNWKDNIVPRQTQELGSRLLMNPDIAVIRIPSVVVDDEFNYLINPFRETGLKIIEIKDYAYDLRIKSK